MPPPACAPGPPGPSAGAGASCQAGNGEKTFQSELTENENKYMGEKKHRNCDLFLWVYLVVVQRVRAVPDRALRDAGPLGLKVEQVVPRLGALGAEEE